MRYRYGKIFSAHNDHPDPNLENTKLPYYYCETLLKDNNMVLKLAVGSFQSFFYIGVIPIEIISITYNIPYNILVRNIQSHKVNMKL